MSPTHLEHGQPVTVLVRPRLTRKDLPASRFPFVRTNPYPVRNVLIERADGSRVVRPWRGLVPTKEAP
ncbi:hypothetical protein [Nonomuraea diastatica]|uniref:Uncharacterized protein n=1 Tax=Nonomuraea diastatica TaxID=1848329 RepID=A0A4R4V9G9_9ACTN|nr:hypothetical protein [Nonomuraea diastatica]TDD01998.1 hypothetical protein E1294_51410 [Nonomuraea diastatica]